ncbi:MAG: hypothetical protein IJM09_03320 [Neisseriaceae bacterium]|nr:hypothetical protein [Neisseriaceae bacterium]
MKKNFLPCLVFIGMLWTVSSKQIKETPLAGHLRNEHNLFRPFLSTMTFMET